MRKRAARAIPRQRTKLTGLLTILAIMARCLGIVSVAQAQEGVAPHPPVNVQASVTDERVTLTWKGNPSDSQVTGYRIERYEGHRSGWHRLEAFLPAAKQVPWDNPDILEIYVDTNVMPSGPYRYRIRSVNSQGIISRYTGEAAASALIVPGREAMKRTGKPPVKQASTTDRRPLRSASAQGLRCGGPGIGRSALDGLAAGRGASGDFPNGASDDAK